MPTRLVSVVFDTPDPAGLAHWWAAALGWVHPLAEPDEVVVEPPDRPPAGVVPCLTFVRVGDPKVAKNRVHLDLASASPGHQADLVARLEDRGARRADIGQSGVPWVVLGDPEGNELCVLEPRDRYHEGGPLAAIVLDVADPDAAAPFWTAASGWPVGFRADGIVSLHNPSGRLPDLDLVRVPDPKRAKNRVHLDVAPEPSEDQSAAVRALEALGARRVDVGPRTVSWVVLADPDGNELCVLTPR